MSKDNPSLTEEQKEILKKAKESNYYEILGLDRFATEKEIRSAYHKKVKLYHPDLNEDNCDFAYEMLYLIYEANTVLTDARLKKEYDDSLSNNSVFDPDGNFSSYYDMASENIIRNNVKFNYDHYFYTYRNKKSDDKKNDEKGSTAIFDFITRLTDKISNYFFKSSKTTKVLIVSLVTLMLAIAAVFEANNFMDHYRDVRKKNMIRNTNLQVEKENEEMDKKNYNTNIVVEDGTFMPEDVKEFLEESGRY